MAELNLDFMNRTPAVKEGGAFDFSRFNVGGYQTPKPAGDRSFLQPVGGDESMLDVGSNFNIGGSQPGVAGPSFTDKLLGGSGETGYLIPGLKTLGGLTSAYTGYKTLGLAEDQFDFAKAQSNRDFGSQAQAYNTELRDRQISRLNQSGQYDTSTPEGQAKFETDLQAYVSANAIDPSVI